ncbi:MAG: hypothetical protein KAI74_03130 [Kiritimatiellae bacterium]|nr:hypothetical protein [Kiritimatiellia bacterium]
MLKRIMSVGLLMICATTVWSVESSMYPLTKSLEVDAQLTKDVVAFDMDEEVFATGGRLNRMRIYRDGATEVPRIIRVKKLIKSVEVVRQYPAKLESLKMLDDNQMEILVRCPKKMPADSKFISINLQTSLRNFEKQVDVYGAGVNNEWVLLSKESTLFDYSSYMDLRNTKVKLPANTHKRYRLVVRQRDENTPSPLTNLSKETRGGKVISEVEQREFRVRPFRVERITVGASRQRQRVSKEVIRDYTVVSSTNYLDKAKPGRSYFEFTTFNTPLSQIEVLTTDRNFSRSVYLEGLDESVDPPRYHQLQMARLESIKLGSYSRQAMKIKLTSKQPGYNYKTYRLVVENRDAPPLVISGVKVSGQVYEALYLPQAGKSDALLYGNDDLKEPSYDVGQVLTSAPRDAIGIGMLGEEIDNPDYKAQKVRMIWKNPRLLFTIAIVFALVVLLFGITKALKQVDESQRTED